MSKCMATPVEEVVELAKKYFCNANLMHLMASDKILWMLKVLRTMGRQWFYEDLAQMAEDGLVIFPDGTYLSTRLTDTPEDLNSDPYGSWIIKVEKITATEELLDAAAYEAFCAEEG